MVRSKTVLQSYKRKRQRGVTTVEYAVMLVLVAISVLAFGAGINSTITDVFSRIASGLSV